MQDAHFGRDSGFRVPQSNSSLCLSYQEDPPRATCLEVFQQLFHKKQTCCQLLGAHFSPPQEKDFPSVWTFLYLSHCLPAPGGLCSSQANLQENNLLPFPKVCWETRHHTHPTRGEAFWALCRVKPPVVDGQGDQCAAQTLTTTSLCSSPWKPARPPWNISAICTWNNLHNICCQLPSKWLLHSLGKFSSSIPCICYLNAWWLEIQCAEITLTKNIPSREMPNLFTLREFSFEHYFVQYHWAKAFKSETNKSV